MDKLKEQWSALPQWQKLLILLVFPIAVMAYIYIMLLAPMGEQLEKSKQEKQELTSRIEELKRLSSPKALEPLKRQGDELRAQLEMKKQELEQVVGQIPSTKDAGNIYRKLGAIAGKSGVKLLSVSLAKPNEVSYILEKDSGGKAVVKTVREQPQQQNQQNQQQQKSKEQKSPQPSNVVKHPTAELRVSFTGTYTSVVNFLNHLRKEKFVSYPSTLRVDRSEDQMLRGELTILIIMKEENI